MLNRMPAFVRRYDLLQPGDTVTCAVSGGADSMALLFGMYLLRDKLGITVCAAHFNHCLRGAESDRDEAHVRKFCSRYDIPLTVGRGNVVAGAKGLEAAARDARYAFLEQLPGKIATAHTADDNAETVLMHVVRGTGLKGLGGIAPARGKLIRPMLTVTRAQVLAFLEEYHVAFVQDSSNDTDAFLRNRLRHRVMPLLAQENPRIAENMSAMALRLREDEDALQVKEDFSEGLLIAWWKDLPEAIRGRVSAAFLTHCGVREPEAEHIGLLGDLALSDKPSARADFPGGITICREYDRLVPLSRQDALEETFLACPGETVVGCWRVLVTAAAEIRNGPDVFTVRPTGRLRLRSRRAGDGLRLPGGTKSLKKLMIDRKIPAQSRDNLPVLADDSGVLGVYGIGVNLEYAAKELPAVQIRLQRI